MDEQPQQTSPRQRLQTLLAIPERQRTDAEWDEIIELEILLAPGNRPGAPQPTGNQNSNRQPHQHNNMRQNGNPRQNNNQQRHNGQGRGGGHNQKQGRWSRGKAPGR